MPEKWGKPRVPFPECWGLKERSQAALSSSQGKWYCEMMCLITLPAEGFPGLINCWSHTLGAVHLWYPGNQVSLASQIKWAESKKSFKSLFFVFQIATVKSLKLLWQLYQPGVVLIIDSASLTRLTHSRQMPISNERNFHSGQIKTR